MLHLSHPRLRACRVYGVGALAVIFAAAGGPLAQWLRVAEESPADEQAGGAPRFRLVLEMGADDGREDARGTNSRQDSGAPSKAPVVLKPLAEHWETGARVQLDSADLPPPCELPCMALCEHSDVANASASLKLAHDPPNPPARGPPNLF